MSATWLEEATRKIQALALLKENWDSYGASPINPDSIAEALNVVASLANVYDIDAPAVGGSPDGNVGLSWDGGSWSLDAKILPDERIEIIYLDELNPWDDIEHANAGLPALLSRLTLPVWRRKETSDEAG
jgi:hypothetical protein